VADKVEAFSTKKVQWAPQLPVGGSDHELTEARLAKSEGPRLFDRRLPETAGECSGLSFVPDRSQRRLVDVLALDRRHISRASSGCSRRHFFTRQAPQSLHRLAF
jgi:hypothetical protein